MIKLLTFDLDNTLWDISPVIVAAEKKMRDWVKEQVPEAVAHLEMDQLRGLYQHIRQAHPEIAHHPTKLRKKILYTQFLQAKLEHDHAHAMTERAFEVFYQGRNQITLFHQAEHALQALSQRFALIALTNGNANLAMVGIEGYFKAHFSAETEGLPKPHAAMFVRALKHAGVTAQETIHIGDHPLEDIEAARSLGFHTIWFNQNGSMAKDACHPNQEINDIGQLVNAVNRIAQTPSA